MYITISFKLKSLLRRLKRLLFKVKKRKPEPLPESPNQEIKSSSSQNDVVLQTLDVKEKQEQVKFFEKQNDLRDVVFDLNPVWDNHQVYGEGTGDDDGWKPAEIRAVKGYEEPIYKDEVQDYDNPWERIKKKNYIINQEEAKQLQVDKD